MYVIAFDTIPLVGASVEFIIIERVGTNESVIMANWPKAVYFF